MKNIHDNVTLLNIDTDSHEIIYDNQSYGSIEPGMTRVLPSFLADHIMKHIIDHILNKKNVMVNNTLERARLAGEMVVDVKSVVQKSEKTESQKLKEKVDEMNATSDLDLIMAKKEVEAAKEAATEKPEMSIEELEAALAAKKAEQEKPEEKVEEVAEEPQTIASEPDENIDRDGLYKWAESELGITIYADEKSKKELDDLPVEEVKKKLGYTNA